MHPQMACQSQDGIGYREGNLWPRMLMVNGPWIQSQKCRHLVRCLWKFHWDPFWLGLISDSICCQFDSIFVILGNSWFVDFRKELPGEFRCQADYFREGIL